MRRISRSAPTSDAPACRSRDSARDTGTPKRASRSAGATACSQRNWPWRICIKVMPRTLDGTANDWPAIAPGAAIGGNTKASAVLVLSSCTMQAPDAPSPAADGNVTASAKYMAVAASVALPPLSRMSRPISAARLSSAATAANAEPAATTRDKPCRPGDRPAGLAAWAARSLSRSVSLWPQAASKNMPASASLRN
jgi:hypothetical protein